MDIDERIFHRKLGSEKGVARFLSKSCGWTDDEFRECVRMLTLTRGIWCGSSIALPLSLSQAFLTVKEADRDTFNLFARSYSIKCVLISLRLLLVIVRHY